jgi:hypothetical protein
MAVSQATHTPGNTITKQTFSQSFMMVAYKHEENER